MAYFECTIGGSGDGSTLTVTCYSGFAGLTISITNGVDTFSDVCPSTSPYEVVFEGLADGMWTVSTVYGGQTYTKTVEINTSTTFNPIPNGATVTPTDDIQTWLNCADIWDKNYTTISQVLADASTLQALIASNNAADYMARSTTWANSVCADANSMTFIGVNDYCSEVLLTNSTWLNEICNSAYFESVLNVKVPTMTSNNTPYGEVIYSTQNSHQLAYYVFDSNFNNTWGSGQNTNSYVGYKFTDAIKVKKITYRNVLDSGIYRIKNYKIQASNDNSTWTDLYTGIAPQNENEQVIILNNDTNYRFLRMYVIDTYSAYGINVRTLQLYGRA